MNFNNETFSLFFKTISNTISDYSSNAITQLQEPMIVLLTSLCIISVMTNWELYFPSGRYNLNNLIIKALHFLFLGTLIKNWSEFVNMLQTTAGMLGKIGGGGQGVADVGSFLTKHVGNMFTTIGNAVSALSLTSESFVILILAIVACLFAIGAIFFITYEMFSAMAEFTIVGALLLVLAPFHILNYTKSIGGKAFDGFVGLFVKLMVTTFFFSMIDSVLSSSFFTIGDTNSKAGVGENTTMLATIITETICIILISLLMKQATAIASGIVSGAVISSGQNLGSMIGGRAVSLASGVGGKVVGTAGKTAGRVLGGAGRSGTRKVLRASGIDADTKPTNLKNKLGSSLYRRVSRQGSKK